MKKSLTTCFLILCTLKCFSTCIAIYVAENGRIYVAADSRRTFYFSEGDKYKYESICKIHNVGDNYFAIAGIDDGALLKSATNALQKNSGIDTAIQSFSDDMVKHYQHLMTDTRQYYPAKFKHFLSDGLASVSFFGFIDGEAYVIDIDFLCYLDNKGQIVTTYRKHQVSALTIIGLSRDIDNANPNDLPANEAIQQQPETYVESLVKIEAKKQPLAVSEPIDVLELTADGVIWFKKNENMVAY